MADQQKEKQMSDGYDITSFEFDYCQSDLATITAAIKRKASLLVVGMPGSGKSRLIDYFLHRPGILEKYGVAPETKFILIDGDLVTTGMPGIMLELLSALGCQQDSAGAPGPVHQKNRLMAEIKGVPPEVDIVVFFDNFVQPLQQSLGEDFFNFLVALRNARPKLNVMYIFLTNLKRDPNGFYKVERLFDSGANRSICWISKLNRKDTFFSIDRQFKKIASGSSWLTETHKERIFTLSGGHPLLTRRLTHLLAGREITLTTEPDHILENSAIQKACQAIWDDLDAPQRTDLINLGAGSAWPDSHDPQIKILRSYGVVTDQNRFFSPLFAAFVRRQKKPNIVLDLNCDENRLRILVTTLGGDQSCEIHSLSKRKRRLFCYLVENQGEVCQKDDLIRIGWPAEESAGVTDRALSRQIDGLRNWLRQTEPLNQIVTIETVWGEGYQLVIKA